MNKTVTISQLLNTPADTYINSIVEGWIAQYVPPFKQGAPAKAKLQEGAQIIDVSLWGGDCSQWNGKRVRLSGKGMKVTEYKGTKQLSVGDKVLIEAASDAIPGDPAPAYGAEPQSLASQTSPRSNVAAVANSSSPTPAVHPATAGMAINRGVEIWIETEGKGGARWDKTAVSRVEEIANELVEMSKRIEAGVPF